MGFEVGDVVRAQIIIKFKNDSIRFTAGNYDDYWRDDAATGPIRIRPVTALWTSPDLFNKITTSYELGYVELPPHIIEDETLLLEDLTKLRETPMPPGTPVSFGHFSNGGGDPVDPDLLEAFVSWHGGAPNYGVALVAEKLAGIVPLADQQVFFERNVEAAVLRITLDRRP